MISSQGLHFPKIFNIDGSKHEACLSIELEELMNKRELMWSIQRFRNGLCMMMHRNWINPSEKGRNQ
jgi:hypothetical protein